MFVDYLCTLNPENRFHFYFYQRVYMRAVARHKYIYATFPRAYSKSFLAVLGLMVRAILYPGSHLFMVSAGKNQSANILSSKMQELCRLIPALYNEILWDTRGTDAKTINTKDTVIYTFRNGSTIENVAASEKTRGRRFTAGVMEEAATLDQTVLQEVIIPTTNVKRSVNGRPDPEDRMNQQQLYITTAGYKNTFAYEKLIQVLCQSVARPDDAIVLGGSWRTPVMEKLLDKNFVRDLRMDGTFNEASFEREYKLFIVLFKLS